MREPRNAYSAPLQILRPADLDIHILASLYDQFVAFAF